MFTIFHLINLVTMKNKRYQTRGLQMIELSLLINLLFHIKFEYEYKQCMTMDDVIRTPLSFTIISRPVRDARPCSEI